MAETYRLRLYADNGSTVAAEFSTDPAHAKPHLMVPDQIAGQEIDLAAGRAKIGGCVVEVVDVPLTPADQDTGYVTSILPNGAGQTARIGRRAHLEVLIGASYENVCNGVIDSIELHESFSSYLIGIKDQRENERRTRAFVNATTSSILPRGVIDGFGYNPLALTWLAPPVSERPLTARYTEGSNGLGGTFGLLSFPTPPKDRQGRYKPPVDQIVTPKMLEQLRSAKTANVGWEFDRIRLHLRATGPGAFTITEGIQVYYPFPVIPLSGVYLDANGKENEVQWMNVFAWTWPAGATRPTNDTDVDVIFGYMGEASRDYPLHLQDMTFGDLLAGLYDGDYSDPGADALVQYDATAVAALTEPVLARITEPLNDEDGIWKWTEQNIFAPLGAAPALDADGLISPIRYALPPDGASLLEIDDAVCEPIPGWRHEGSDAVNVVSVEYPRFYNAPADRDANSENSGGDGLAERRITVEHQDVSSIAFLGERPLRIKAETLGAIGGTDVEALTGDVTDELGSQLAAARTRQALDRFLMGGQHFSVRITRAALGSSRVGDWCIGSCSWWPDYETGERGPTRLLQVIRVQHLDTAWSEVELVDAGPDNTPVGQPTLGTLTVAADGSVVIPVTAVAAGSEARVDYAINTTEPAADSALWRFAGRTAVAGSISTAPAPSDVTVWVRARGEKEGRRPSAWTTAVSIAVPIAARVRDVRLVINQDTGGAEVTWTPNLDAQGVRIYWSVHDPLIVPPFADDVDVDADDGAYVFPANTVSLGERLSVRVEPWTGWTGSAVSGTAGVFIQATALRGDDASETGGIHTIAIGLSEPSGNLIRINVESISVAATRWRAWMRLGGSWPTVDGLEDGPTDDRYLAVESTWAQRTVFRSADDGVWSVITKAGEPYGPANTEQITIAGSPTAGALGDIYVVAYTDAGQDIHEIGYEYNQVIEDATPGDFEIDIDYNHTSRSTVFNLTTDRDVQHEFDDVDAVPFFGSYQHVLGASMFSTSVDPDGEWRSYSYQLTVKLSGTPIAVVSVTIAGFYKVLAP